MALGEFHPIGLGELASDDAAHEVVLEAFIGHDALEAPLELANRRRCFALL
jgi:hypothetical protein